MGILDHDARRNVISIAWKPQWRRIAVLAVFAVLAIIAMYAGKAQGSPPPSAGKEVPAADRTSGAGRVALYAGLGDELTEYDVDVEHSILLKRGSVTLPGNVGEGWAHPSGRYLYVPWSNSTRSSGNQYGVSAFSIDPASGALTPDGQPAPLPARASNVTGDIPGTHLLIANNKNGVTVYRIGPDGAIGSEVEQQGPFDVGIVQHQVRVNPSNKLAILVTRGNYTHEQYPNLDSPGPLKILEPGALKVFRYKDGLLMNEVSITRGGGYGFQSRHVDFHPSQPWIFLTLEPQNKLYVYKDLGDTLSPEPLFIKDTLADAGNVRPMQHAGTIHVHPSGKFVYVANRANGTTDFDGKPVFVGGENSIAVYSIKQDTGEPTLIQNIDTRGILPRTFAIDSSGRMLVAAHQTAFSVRDGKNIRTVPASLAVFQIRGDGKLDFARKYDLETGGQSMTWASPQGYTEGKSVSWVELVTLP